MRISFSELGGVASHTSLRHIQPILVRFLRVGLMEQDTNAPVAMNSEEVIC